MSNKVFKIRDGVFATGQIGKKAQIVLERVGKSKYAGVRGVRPTLTAEHVQVKAPKALRNEFSNRAPRA